MWLIVEPPGKHNRVSFVKCDAVIVGDDAEPLAVLAYFQIIITENKGVAKKIFPDNLGSDYKTHKQ